MQKKNRFLKTLFVFLFYRVVWLNDFPWQNGKIRHTYKLEPNKLPLVVFLVVASVFIFLYGGIKTVLEIWKNVLWGSGEFRSRYFDLLPNEKRPGNWAACKKY